MDEAEAEADEEAKDAVKPPQKVPTLYVRNLNDKLKVEGKSSSICLTLHFFIFRNASQPVYALFDLR